MTIKMLAEPACEKKGDFSGRCDVGESKTSE